MNETEEALRRAAAESPHDETPHLILADYAHRGVATMYGQNATEVHGTPRNAATIALMRRNSALNRKAAEAHAHAARWIAGRI